MSKMHFGSDAPTCHQGLQGIASFVSNEASCSCLFCLVEIWKVWQPCHSMLSGQPFVPNNTYALGHLGISTQ
jgi:hypothetical protein